jgi:hypothetical protein
MPCLVLAIGGSPKADETTQLAQFAPPRAADWRGSRPVLGRHRLAGQRVVVHGKGRHEARLPLSCDLAEAVVTYLKRAAGRALCAGWSLRSVAPIWPRGARGSPVIVRHACARRECRQFRALKCQQTFRSAVSRKRMTSPGPSSAAQRQGSPFRQEFIPWPMSTTAGEDSSRPTQPAPWGRRRHSSRTLRAQGARITNPAHGNVGSACRRTDPTTTGFP